MDGALAAFISVGYIIFFAGSFLSGWIFYRRNHQPLKARRPLLTMTMLELISVISLMIAVSYSVPLEAKACWINLLIVYLVAFFDIFVFLRLLFLAYAYSFTTSALNYANGKGHRLWFIKNKNWFNYRYFLGLATFLAVLVVTIPFMAGGSEFARKASSRMLDIECSEVYIDTLHVQNALYLLFIVECWGIWFFVRNIRENFRIKDEFWQLASWSSVGFFILLVLELAYLVSGSLFVNILFLFAYYYGVLLIPLIVSGVRILRLTYEFEGMNSLDTTMSSVADDTPQTRKRIEFLTDLVELDEGYELLTKFLAAEFCVENALFLRAVSDMKKMNSWKEKCATCMQVIKDFVDEDSIYCINISGYNRSTIMDVFKHENPDEKDGIASMELAESEIKSLLVKDSLMRFERKPEFAKMKSSIRILKSKEVVLEHMEMV